MLRTPLLTANPVEGEVSACQSNSPKGATNFAMFFWVGLRPSAETQSHESDASSFAAYTPSARSKTYFSGFVNASS